MEPNNNNKKKKKSIISSRWCGIVVLVILLLVLLGICIFLLVWFFIIHKSSSSSDGAPVPTVITMKGSVFINGTVPIATTDDDFICATMDYGPSNHCDSGVCWGNAALLDMDLQNPILIRAVQAFKPLKLRVGGTLQDRVTYQTAEDKGPCNPITINASDFLGFSQGCLPISRWDELHAFFDKTGAVVTFGLNALYGKTVKQGGIVGGDWNSSNAESLLRYTVDKGYRIIGWELGNELSGKGIGASVTAEQYATDLTILKNLVIDVYRDSESKPMIMAPGGFFDHAWFNDFMDRSNQTVQVVTHHIYNLGSGADPHLIDKILNSTYLDGVAGPISGLRDILKDSGTCAVAWVGEAGGAHNSGGHLVTDAFVSSFWYLDQLGIAATYDTKTYCRQTLIGGGYGLLNSSTFLPNPDYYSALLWHRLMGSNVLRTKISGMENIRAYSHCSKNITGFTLLLINLDRSNTAEVQVFVSQNGTTISLQEHQSSKHDGHKREEYHLTANDGDLHTQVTTLNGKVLTVSSSGSIPPLEPFKVSFSDPVTVAPLSIVFVRFPIVNITACK